MGETIYSLNLLPLGGFVRMLGETGNKGDMGSVDDQHIPGSFASKSKRVRAAVLAAGSAMNLLLVPVLFSIGLMIGEPVPCDGCNRVEIYGVQAGSPAAEAGLQGGDVFVSLNGQPIDDLEDVRTIVRAGGPEQPVTAVVLRDGEPLTLHPHAPRRGSGGRGREPAHHRHPAGPGGGHRQLPHLAGHPHGHPAHGGPDPRLLHRAGADALPRGPGRAGRAGGDRPDDGPGGAGRVGLPAAVHRLPLPQPGGV